jgi:hypothetical protein
VLQNRATTRTLQLKLSSAGADLQAPISASIQIRFGLKIATSPAKQRQIDRRKGKL